MPDTSSPPRERDPYYDNAKLVIIWTVVAAHGMELFAGQNDAAAGLYKMITAFATPAFAFLSGMFSRADLTVAEALKVKSRVLIPYFAFQVIYFAIDHLYNGYPLVSYSIFNSYWGLWYVLGLFVWRLLLPFVMASRYPLLLSVAIGFAAGFLPANSALVVNPRVIVFLPIFVAGHLAGRDRERFKRLTATPVRIGAAACLAAFVALFIQFHDLVKWTWLLPRANAEQMGLSGGEWLCVRAGVYCLTLILGACVFSLVPRRRSFLTHLGAGTFYVYLLHIPLIRLATIEGLAGCVRPILGSAVLEIAAVLVAAALVTLALSQKPVRIAFGFLVEPGPRAVRVAAPLFVALAVGLAFVPSLNRFGAAVVRQKDIASGPAQAESKPPVEIPPAGLIIRLGGLHAKRKAALGLDCNATFDVELYRGRRFVGTAEIVPESTVKPIEIELPVPKRGKYDTLVIEPWRDMPCGESSHLSSLRFF